MAECPACFGEGQIDCRDLDAYIEEHWTDAEINRAVAAGMVRKVGIIECDECEGTGVVSEERLADLMAAARASVDQVFARLRAEGRIP